MAVPPTWGGPPGALAGKAALVCGGTGEIGAAIARALAERHAGVAVHCRRRRDRAEEIVARLPPHAAHAVAQGDLAESAEAVRLVDAASAQLGAAPTILVDAASPSLPPRLVREISDDDLLGNLVGFHTHVNVCRAALPGMRAAGEGRIVLVSGALASRPFPGFALYGAVKAGLHTFARTLALEEGAAGITVNVVAPGRVETPSAEPSLTPLEPPFEALDRLIRLRAALPRMASPEDVAAIVCFLASPEAEAVTGQIVFLAAGEPI